MKNEEFGFCKSILSFLCGACITGHPVTAEEKANKKNDKSWFGS